MPNNGPKKKENFLNHETMITFNLDYLETIPLHPQRIIIMAYFVNIRSFVNIIHYA